MVKGLYNAQGQLVAPYTYTGMGSLSASKQGANYLDIMKRKAMADRMAEENYRKKQAMAALRAKPPIGQRPRNNPFMQASSPKPTDYMTLLQQSLRDVAELNNVQNPILNPFAKV
jgi:hypothetical protein